MIEITKEIKERQFHLLECVQNAIELTGEDVQIEFGIVDTEHFVTIIHWCADDSGDYRYGYRFGDGVWHNQFPIARTELYEIVLQQLDEFAEKYRKGEEF